MTPVIDPDIFFVGYYKYRKPGVLKWSLIALVVSLVGLALIVKAILESASDHQPQRLSIQIVLSAGFVFCLVIAAIAVASLRAWVIDRHDIVQVDVTGITTIKGHWRWECVTGVWLVTIGETQSRCIFRFSEKTGRRSKMHSDLVDGPLPPSMQQTIIVRLGTYLRGHGFAIACERVDVPSRQWRRRA